MTSKVYLLLLVINYISNEPLELLKEVSSLGANVISVCADVSKFYDAEYLIKQTKKEFGSVDILVNNAGITRDMLLMRMTENQFDDVINVNLKGCFNTIRHVSSIMLKQKSGVIINISSVVAITGNIGQANYSASKAGIIGLTKSTARELSSRGITCNAIAPGFIKTDMTDVLSNDLKSGILDTIPLKRFGKPEEVAEAVYFLSKNTYITGQVLNIDGGMLM